MATLVASERSDFFCLQQGFAAAMNDLTVITQLQPDENSRMTTASPLSRLTKPAECP